MGTIGERGFEKFTPAQRWIATGQLVEVASPEGATMVFGELPPPVKVLRAAGRQAQVPPVHHLGPRRAARVNRGTS